ncbi:unknown [Eggerthella sp. CAG:209]|nr:unknown [Eggerthella sp. CAG:209]
MPGDVVEPVKGNGHVGGFVAVEFYVAVIEDVQHGDFGIFRQGRMLAAKIFKSLSGCLCGAAMA